jgi:L-arabinonolactonase
MNKFELIDSINVSNTLGECVLWNDRQQSVWWTDILEAKLYSYNYAKRALAVLPLPERLASFGFTEYDDTLICAFASGFALYNLMSETVEWLARPAIEMPGQRFNDGRVDRQGRFWAGTLVEAQSTDGEMKGSLYRLSGRDCKKVLGGINISNSICWSPDSSKFYFADSPTHTINAYEFDALSGTLGSPEIFTRTTPPYEPDGSTVDANGYLWNAMWGSGKVIRYAPNGHPVEEFVLPVSQPTCVAFGGHDMNILFVTTARVGLTEDQLKTEPQAGHLFIYQTPYEGLPESRFKV